MRKRLLKIFLDKQVFHCKTKIDPRPLSHCGPILSFGIMIWKKKPKFHYLDAYTQVSAFLVRWFLKRRYLKIFLYIFCVKFWLLIGPHPVTRDHHWKYYEIYMYPTWWCFHTRFYFFLLKCFWKEDIKRYFFYVHFCKMWNTPIAAPPYPLGS